MRTKTTKIKNMKNKKTMKQKPSDLIKKETLSMIEKKNIVQEINPITDLEIEKEYQQLRELKCKGAIAASAGVKIGNKIVDKFTFIERLATKGHTGIDFYTFWYNRNYFEKWNT